MMVGLLTSSVAFVASGLMACAYFLVHAPQGFYPLFNRGEPAGPQRIGMTAVDRSKVFEPFRRGKNVGNIGGTGLGLSVTRKIVEAHGGSIDVRSEPGSGSVFSVRLPLTSDADVDRDRSGRTVESASLLAR
jgi:hypothetical protein